MTDHTISNARLFGFDLADWALYVGGCFLVGLLAFLA
jgi:hypothetical protein